MHLIRKTSLALATSALALLAGSAVQAQTALTPTSVFTYNDTGYDTGYSFTVGSNALTLTSLGSLNNVDGTADVGLYDVSGNLLSSTSVTLTASTSNAPPTYSFAKVTAPLILSANTTYQVASFNTTSGATFYFGSSVANAGADPSITVLAAGNGQGGYNFSGHLSPADSGTTYKAAQVFDVANFQFTVAPEPSQNAALGLGILGVGGLALAARRRRVNG